MGAFTADNGQSRGPVFMNLILKLGIISGVLFVFLVVRADHAKTAPTAQMPPDAKIAPQPKTSDTKPAPSVKAPSAKTSPDTKPALKAPKPKRPRAIID